MPLCMRTTLCTDDGVGMMSFSDNDLKRFEENLADSKAWPHGGITTSSEILEALLARLEAAERYIQTCRDLCCDVYHKDQADAYRAWCKSKGIE